MRTGTLSTASIATVTTTLLSVIAAIVVIAYGVAIAPPPVRSADKLDLRRYAGTWYELARVPNKLETNCSADVTATYRVLGDGSMSLVTRCVDNAERVNVAVAQAQSLPGAPAQMRLSYLPSWLDWWPLSHDEHWVVMVDNDYRYAVVSDPSRESLSILSRTPMIEPRTYDSIVSRLREQRYPVERLVPTEHRSPEQALPEAVKPPLMV